MSNGSCHWSGLDGMVMPAMNNNKAHVWGSRSLVFFFLGRLGKFVGIVLVMLAGHSLRINNGIIWEGLGQAPWERSAHIHAACLRIGIVSASRIRTMLFLPCPSMLRKKSYTLAGEGWGSQKKFQNGGCTRLSVLSVCLSVPPSTVSTPPPEGYVCLF